MTEPISIFDLRRKSQKIMLNGGEVEIQIYGLTARQICDHLERFPAVASLSVGGNFNLAEAMKATPGAINAWVASACGNHNDERAEQAIDDNLTAEDATYIVEVSLGLTFSRGFGPFATRLAALMEHITVTPGRGQATRSPMPSPPSMVPMTNGSGTSPLDSSPPSSSSPSDGDSSNPPPTSST